VASSKIAYLPRYSRWKTVFENRSMSKFTLWSWA